MRCFIALPLPPEAREALARALSPLRSKWPRLRWTSPDGYHLTLAFLGEIGEPALACARRALGAAAQGRSFAFSFSVYDFLPPRGAPRVLFADLAEDPEGSSAFVHRVVNEALEAEARQAGLPPLNREWAGIIPGEPGSGGGAGGFPRGGRPYRAHITLARLNPGAPYPDRPALERASREARFPGAPWTLDRCALYKSDLQRGGAVYTELASVALA